MKKFKKRQLNPITKMIASSDSEMNAMGVTIASTRLGRTRLNDLIARAKIASNKRNQSKLKDK